MLDDLHAHASRIEASQRQHDLNRVAPMFAGSGPSPLARVRAFLARRWVSAGRRLHPGSARRLSGERAAMRSAEPSLGAAVPRSHGRSG